MRRTAQTLLLLAPTIAVVVALVFVKTFLEGD